MPRPDLSIVAIIPLYNGAKYIEGALRSVWDQTLPADEVIIVDDGSTDDGPQIVERLAQEGPVTLLRKSNGGQSSARNHGVAHSTSSLIAFLDQDDAWYPGHLAHLIKPFRQKRDTPLGWVYSNLDEVDEAGRMMMKSFLDIIPTEHPKRNIVNCLSNDMFVLPSASLISRTAFEAVGGFDERLSGYEDDDLFLRLFLACFDNIYINKPLSMWRIFPNSYSYTYRMARSRMIYAEKLLTMFPPNPIQNRFFGRDCIAPRFTRQTLGDCLSAIRRHDGEMLKTAHTHLGRLRPHLRIRTGLASTIAIAAVSNLSLASLLYRARLLLPIFRRAYG